MLTAIAFGVVCAAALGDWHDYRCTGLASSRSEPRNLASGSLSAAAPRRCSSYVLRERGFVLVGAGLLIEPRGRAAAKRTKALDSMLFVVVALRFRWCSRGAWQHTAGDRLR